jgi:hypothetical protein
MGVSKRKCAFCSTSENLSREHIFPSSVIKRFEKDFLSINDKSDKVFKADLVVKDVCETCNNGVLSDLDSGFIKLFDKYMHEPILPGEGAEFHFDYNELLKSLLKISYNSARASSDGLKAITAMRKFVPYIMGKTNVIPDVMLRLQIVTSSKKLDANTLVQQGMFEAKILRSAKLQYDGPQKSNFIVRLVAFNSFWFYLIIPTKKVSVSKKQTFIQGFEQQMNLSGIPLSCDIERIKVPKERTTYMHPSLLSGMRRENA